MNYEYNKEITCINCGEQNVKITPALNGISFCECKVCGKKFIVQTDGSDTLNKYIAARQKIFALLESGGIKDGEAKRGLDELVRSFPVIADIDPVYFWYKIELITRRFKDYSKPAMSEAKTEYLKIPKKDLYFITQDDIKRNNNYEIQYDRYISRQENKVKLIVTAAMSVLCAAFIGAGIFVGVSTPIVKSADAGVSVKLSNASYGLFGKFSVTSDIKRVESSDGAYALAYNFINNETGKADFYNLSLLKGGFESAPKNNVTVSVKVDTSLRRDRLCVYHINENGGYEEVESSVSADYTVVFKTDRLGMFAVAEKPFSVNFDTDGGNEIKTQKVDWGTTATVPQGDGAPQKTGYTFNGWYAGSAEYDFTSPVITDINLTARWTANKYSVSYYADGVLVHTQQVTYDENTALRDFDKRGYSVEWYNGETRLTDGAWKIADDTRLDARWVALTYSVTLNDGFTPCCEAETAGGGTVTATFDAAAPSVKIPKRTGYALEGYYTQSGGGGVKYIDGEGNGVCAWNEDKDCTLYAHWVVAEEYTGYKFITSASELFAVAQNTSGKYLLTHDVNLGGKNWSPIYFNGVFDGGHHKIYNFKITDSSQFVYGEDFGAKCLGFFGVLNGTVKNLQLGNTGYDTLISRGEWARKMDAGMIAGFSNGVVENCRVVNCSVEISSESNNGGKGEHYLNAGAVTGVQQNGGKISRCYVEGCRVSTAVTVRWDRYSGSARSAGIAGYAENCTLENCYVKSSSCSAYAKSFAGSWGNDSGTPYARAGGLIGHATNTVLTLNAVNGNNNLNASIDDSADYVLNGGNAYRGSMFGSTNNTTSSNLIGVNTSLQCSGSNSYYGGYSVIGNDSVIELIAKNSAFNNGYWIGEGEKIALKFYD